MINPPSPPRANSDELDPLHPLFTLPAQTPAVGAVRMLGGQRYTMVSLLSRTDAATVRSRRLSAGGAIAQPAALLSNSPRRSPGPSR